MYLVKPLAVPTGIMLSVFETLEHYVLTAYLKLICIEISVIT